MIILLFAGSIAGIYFGIRFKISQDELAKYSESIQIIEDLKIQLKSANEREETLTANLALVTSERDQNQQQVNSLTIEIETKNTRITELENKAEEDKTSIANLTAEKTRLEGELSTSEEANSAKQSRITELEAEITRLETSLSNTQSAKAEVESERNQLQVDKTDLESQIAQANERINALEADKLALQNEVTRLTGLLESYDEIKNGTREVTFYNGEVLYASKAVKTGTYVTGIETPIKEISKFVGWYDSEGNKFEIETTPITEDVTLYAHFEQKTFNECTWTELSEVSSRASQYFNVGDEKTTTINGVSYTLIILDFNHDKLAEESGTAGITIGLKNVANREELIDFYISSCSKEIYERLSTKILSEMDEELKSAIKLVEKATSSETVNSCLYSVKVFMLNVIEYTGKTDVKGEVENNATQYEYFKENKLDKPVYSTSKTGGFHYELLSNGNWSIDSYNPDNNLYIAFCI